MNNFTVCGVKKNWAGLAGVRCLVSQSVSLSLSSCRERWLILTRSLVDQFQRWSLSSAVHCPFQTIFIFRSTDSAAVGASIKCFHQMFSFCPFSVSAEGLTAFELTVKIHQKSRFSVNWLQMSLKSENHWHTVDRKAWYKPRRNSHKQFWFFFSPFTIC